MILQLSLSLAGIVFLMLLARWLGFDTDPRLSGPDEAARIAADAIAGFAPGDVAVAGDGRSALVAGSDGRVALLRPLGDRWVVRDVRGAAARVDGGRLHLALVEPMFAPADLDLGADAGRWAARL
ncbi:hypothetical protein [Sandarakinorhabdus sp.]|uniref:hypothetical protein n=1 Tax=Sandarakinorhabdus sp. TaxID=1916663 RepID=UPI00286E5D4F|nr:hypothetical protein [Sandarakinorhabdus sp.]